MERKPDFQTYNDKIPVYADLRCQIWSDELSLKIQATSLLPKLDKTKDFMLGKVTRFRADEILEAKMPNKKYFHV